MAKLRIPISLITTQFSAKWVICNEPDVAERWVEIPVNEFKQLASNTDDVERLAQLIVEWVRSEGINRQYNEFVNNIINDYWMD